MESKMGIEFGIEWDLILDSQSVAEILAKFSIYDDKISAVMVRFDSVGDIVEVWITEGNAPYLFTSEYMPIDYWRNDEPTESEIFYHVETVHADCPSCNTFDVVSPAKLLQMLSWLNEYRQSIEEGTFQLYLMVDLMTMTIKPE